MQVTALIEKLRAIEENDPTTEIVVSVAGMDRHRVIQEIDYVYFSTLHRPIVEIQCSLSFIDPESISK